MAAWNALWGYFELLVLWLVRTYYALLLSLLGVAVWILFFFIRWVLVPFVAWLWALWRYVRGRAELADTPGGRALHTPPR